MPEQSQEEIKTNSNFKRQNKINRNELVSLLKVNKPP